MDPGGLVWDGPGERCLHRCGGEGFSAFLVTVEVEPGTPRDGPRLAVWEDALARRSFVAEMRACWAAGRPDRAETGRLVFARLRHLALAGGEQRPPALVRALEAIEASYVRDLGVEELAAVAGVSPSRLHFLCQRHLGSSPHRRLLERRLQAAREALAGGDAPLAVVARSCGFADAAALCRAFRRVTGCTPGRYRTLAGR